MSQEFPSYGGTRPHQPRPAKTSGNKWFLQSWVLALGAGLLGLLFGAIVGSFAVAASVPDVKSTSAYKSVVTELGHREAELRQSEADLDEVKDVLTAAQERLSDVAGQVPAREAAVTKAEAALVKREAAVAAKEKDVLRREKAVGLVEKEIAANTVPGEGVFQVGVDMKPGLYKSAGSGDCYYAVLGDANGNDIRSNNITSGPATVTVSRGDYFQSRGCAEWVLQR